MTTQEFRQLWITALRSNTYKQGKTTLHKDDQFCCLGVACDLYSKEYPEQLKITKHHIGNHTKYAYNTYTIQLPPAVAQSLKLKDPTGRFKILKRKDSSGHLKIQHTSLSLLNDKGTPFEEIAYIIESNPTDLFID